LQIGSGSASFFLFLFSSFFFFFFSFFTLCFSKVMDANDVMAFMQEDVEEEEEMEVAASTPPNPYYNDVPPPPAASAAPRRPLPAATKPPSYTMRFEKEKADVADDSPTTAEDIRHMLIVEEQEAVAARSQRFEPLSSSIDSSIAATYTPPVVGVEGLGYSFGGPVTAVVILGTETRSENMGIWDYLLCFSFHLIG
jgi:hypothetical protein